MNFTRILFFLVGLTVAGAARGGTLYAVDSTTDSLYTLNKTTGAATLIGATGQDLTEGGLIFDSSTGRLIASNLFVEGSFDARGIGFATPGSAALSPPSDYANSTFIPSLAYHAPSNTLYGLSRAPYQLQTIDRTTGASSNGPVPAADPPNRRGSHLDHFFGGRVRRCTASANSGSTSSIGQPPTSQPSVSMASI